MWDYLPSVCDTLYPDPLSGDGTAEDGQAERLYSKNAIPPTRLVLTTAAVSVGIVGALVAGAWLLAKMEEKFRGPEIDHNWVKEVRNRERDIEMGRV